MTYTESLNLPVTNWLDVLRPGLNLKELIDLRKLSSQWPTCACGNQCDIIPRWKDENRPWNKANGEPRDDMLSALGNRFNYAISDALDYAARDNSEGRDKSIDKARYIFLKIEQRAAEIIEQLKYD